MANTSLDMHNSASATESLPVSASTPALQPTISVKTGEDSRQFRWQYYPGVPWTEPATVFHTPKYSVLGRYRRSPLINTYKKVQVNLKRIKARGVKPLGSSKPATSGKAPDQATPPTSRAQPVSAPSAPPTNDSVPERSLDASPRTESIPHSATLDTDKTPGRVEANSDTQPPIPSWWLLPHPNEMLRPPRIHTPPKIVSSLRRIVRGWPLFKMKTSPAVAQILGVRPRDRTLSNKLLMQISKKYRKYPLPAAATPRSYVGRGTPSKAPRQTLPEHTRADPPRSMRSFTAPQLPSKREPILWDGFLAPFVPVLEPPPKPVQLSMLRLPAPPSSPASIVCAQENVTSEHAGVSSSSSH